jgi:hypothetical protein
MHQSMGVGLEILPVRVVHLRVPGELTSLPGCSQIVVSHDVFVPNHLRGNGLGKLSHFDRLDQMRTLGYDVAMCTANLSNAAQLHILEGSDWLRVFQFKSSKTGNDVGVFMKHL